MRRLLLSAAALLAVATILFVSLRRSPRNDSPGSIEGPAAEAEDPRSEPALVAETSASEVPPSISPTTAESAGEPDEDPARQPIAPSWSGRVLSTTGAPITSADVTWHLDGDAPHGATSQPDGRFRFPGDSNARRGSLVGTCPGHLAAGLALAPDASEPEVLLEPAAPVRARVTRASQPVSGATVVSRGHVRAGAREVEVERRSATDADGRCVVAALPGESILFARADDEQSEVWVGVHAEVGREVELALLETFTLEGRVRGAPDRAALERAAVVVRKARDEDLWDRGPHQWKRHLARAEVQGDGSWIATDVPWADAGDYIVRLEASGCVPQEKLVTIESPADVPRIDLDWMAGPLVTFLTRTEDGAGVPDVDVVVAWSEEGRWARALGRSDSSGAAPMTLPPVTYYVRASAEGFANYAVGPAFAQDGAQILLPLTPAARVAGRCLADGMPVTDFRVTYWGSDATSRQTLAFEARADGSFEIRDAPTPTVHVMASADERAPSAVRSLESAPGEVVELELELTRARLGRGRVLDGTTGLPIPGSTVQAHPRWTTRVLEPWGPSLPCDADGAFAALPLPRESASLEVRAPGYQKRFVEAPAPGEDGAVDFELVTLLRTRTLTVQLTGEGVEDFSAWSGQLYVAGAPTRSAADGHLVFEDVAPGERLFLVHGPNGSRQDVQLVLESGREWEHEVWVAGESGLSVHVRPGDDGPLPDQMWARATYHDGQRAPICGQAHVDEGRARLPFVRAERALVQIFDGAAECIAAQWFDLADGERQVELEVGTPVTELAFVAPDGRPLVEPQVSLTPAGDPFGLEVVLHAGADGRLRLRGWTAERAHVRVVPLPGQLVRSVLVEMGLGVAQPIVVTVDVGNRIRARLVERGEPRGGIPVGAREPEDWRTPWHGASGTDGLLEIAGVGPGTYELTVEGGGCWPVTRLFESAREPAAQDFEVRRVGGAELLFLREGLPVVGLVVAASSLELGESVAGWIAQGHATAGPTGLVTDASGRIHLEGVPNGPYRWEAGGTSGTFAVPPAATAQVTCEVP